jgi:hypothetical protein
MTTTPAGHFRDTVGEFIRKEASERDSEAYKVRCTPTTNRPIREYSRSFYSRSSDLILDIPRVVRVLMSPKLSTPRSECQVSNSISSIVDHFNNRETVPGVAHPGATGVIYCTDRAMANGFSYSNEEWVRVVPELA